MNTFQRKVCLLGDFAVGKTSLVRRFVEGVFDERYLSTIGVSISRKPVALADHTLNLIIWDLAGGTDLDEQSRRSYLRGAAAGLLVCDLTRPGTLDTLGTFADALHAFRPGAPVVVAANKADLKNERRIDEATLGRFAAALGTVCFETSARDATNVDNVFGQLAAMIEESS